jgi:glycosyltransferase involved in cell wall biosynthesis
MVTPMRRLDTHLHANARPTAHATMEDGAVKAGEWSSRGTPDANQPVFGFILIGGALVGAQVRDIRLANELSERGYPVHVWWAMDRSYRAPLRSEIQQHWLFSSSRYGGYSVSWADDYLGRFVSRWTNDERRARVVQNFPGFLSRIMKFLVWRACRGVDRDERLIRRFSKELTAAGVTHLLPTLGILACFARAAKQRVSYPLKYLVTFQGYELYANYAREIGLEEDLYRCLYEVVEDSDWPAVAVSSQYLERIHKDIGIPRTRLTAIPPGVPAPTPLDDVTALRLVSETMSGYRPDRPLITYVGRRDSEKGIDLLLYAAGILKRRGLDFQLAVCGPTAFGNEYLRACRQIAENLRCPVLWQDFISDELRSALFMRSHCVVYPSIHAEPFGMVPVEAMAYGTPVVVPDTGGISGVTRVGAHRAGLNFRSWDSGHLAEQLGRLLEDAELRNQLAADAPFIADHFSVHRLGDRILDHLGIVRLPESTAISTWRQPLILPPSRSA